MSDLASKFEQRAPSVDTKARAARAQIYERWKIVSDTGDEITTQVMGEISVWKSPNGVNRSNSAVFEKV